MTASINSNLTTDNKKVPEATILDLLEYDTSDLLAMTQEQIDVYLQKAILDQEEILKRVPKKKVSVVMDVRDSSGGMSRKQAAEKRNAAAIDLPPEIAELAAATQAMLFEAQQQMKKPN